MESAIVSVSMGAVNPLLGKLSRLITEEHAKLKGRERKEVIISLKDEFGYMVALLRVSAMAHQPDAQVKEWMRQVREVAYDTEDCIDLFWHDQIRRELNFLDRVSLSPRARSKPKRLIKEMRQLLDRLVQASERRTRYNLVDGMPAASDAINAGAVDLGSGSVTIDPLLLQMEEASPVAIGGPASELVDRLMDKKRHLRVVSIVGMAGIGKTTLAKKVYGTVMTQFDCQASVYVGRSPSIKTVLMDILQQVSRQERAGTTLDEHKAMTQLRSFLANKRYLIIFDDIWSISAWKAINCALPGNDARSRIITTSRLHGVAKSCSNHPDDVTYVMKTLGESDSNRLFHSRIFGSEEKCLEECSEVHNNVSKICGGLPWSILVVASLVAGKHAETGGWEMINKSTLEHYHPSKGMKKILHMSYADLTLPMKSCLLYLSVFPKNCIIRKDRLIWRWVAEGFIPVKGEECILDTGRSYFNELINRSLIQPVFGTDDDENDPIGCTVHDAVHDFVVSMSSEENFVTLEEELISMPRDVVRRLSLNYAKQEDGTLALDPGSINNLSQVRSLTVSGCAQRMPHLANFLLLRVLDLEDAEGLESRSLEDIGRLFNLRYLGLGGDNVTELPESIGELRLLETLDVRGTKVRKLPTSIARLQKIARLFANVLDDIPDGIEKMQDLQELSMIIVNSRRLLNLVGALVKSRQLKVLGVKWSFSDDDQQGDVQTSRSDFVSSLNKVAEHSKLEHLYLRSDGKCSLNFLADSWVPPCLLQKLVVKSVNYYFAAIPKHLASCLNLTNLEIAINLDKEEDLSIIAHLPALIILKLSVKEKRLIIRKGFTSLEVFWLECRDGAPKIEFLVGAMPKLRKLHLSFKLLPLKVQGGFHFGLRNLSSLKQVHAKIICEGASVSEVDSVESAIESDLSRHLNSPTLKLAKHNYSEEKVTMDEGRMSTVEKVNN